MRNLLVTLFCSSIATFSQTTTLAIGYTGGSLGVASAVQTAMEKKILDEMKILFPATMVPVSLPCAPSTGNPRKICIDFSEVWSQYVGSDMMGYSIWLPPSLKAGLIRSRVKTWIENQQANTTFSPEYIGDAIARLVIHELGHACGVGGDYNVQTGDNKNFYMALKTDVQNAKFWRSDEKYQIISVCSPPTSTGPTTYAAAEPAPTLPNPNLGITFSFTPPPVPVPLDNLVSNWGFIDAHNFSLVSGNANNYVPPGKYSASMGKTQGQTSGWATTKLFTSPVDRNIDGYTVQFSTLWSYTNNSNPLSSSNYLAVSLCRWNGSYLQSDYSFYYRPKNMLDASGANDHLIKKSNHGTLLAQASSGDAATWTGDWMSFKIQVDKVQAAGGTGEIKYFRYHPQNGWKLISTVVDNEFTSFNTLDFWHETNLSTETTVKIDHIIVRKGIN